MLRKILNTGILLTFLWGLDTFILSNVRIAITEQAQVTAIICCCIIFAAIVIPFILYDKGR
jgi:hypothetical protein